MNCFVIGYGSIGKRHTRLLTELGCKVSVISQRDVDFPTRYRSIAAALQKEEPSYCIIANRTSDHYAAFVELAENRFDGILLIEKPLFHDVFEIPANNFAGVYAAYNLRFHPVIQLLHDYLKDQSMVSVQAYVGQYLPDWRVDSDYRHSYSAHKRLGGGVLRDLSHELDMIHWLCGGWTNLVAFGGHYSSLEIDSDDVYHILITTRLCPIVNVHLNYLDRCVRREMIIHTEVSTITIDLIKHSMHINGSLYKAFDIDRDFTYRSQHEAILMGDDRHLCTLAEGMDVLRMIHAAEKSMEQRMWIPK